MKRFVKVCVILGIIFFIMGCGITISAVAMGADWSGIYRGIGFAHSYMDEEDWEYDTAVDENSEWKTYRDVSKIDLEMKVGYVSVESGGEEGTITVIYEDDSDCYKSYMKDSTLKIECEGPEAIKRRNPVDYSNRKIKILIPEGYRLEEFDMELDAGGGDIRSLSVKKMNLEVNAGSVEITDVQVSELDIENKAGSVSFSGDSNGDVNIECKTGSVSLDLSGAETEYDYNLEAAMGDITIGDQNYSGLSYHKSRNNGAAYKMNVDCSMGEITVSFRE